MVLSEIATLCEAAQGTSLARFGHGELAIMNGRDANLQKYDPRLAEELRGILRASPCLVAVPHARGKRSWEWQVFLDKYGKDIDQNRWYGSSFISRSDEAEWPSGYADLARGILKTGVRLDTYGSNDYQHIDEFEDIASRFDGKPILLSCGPTATVLAHRLSLRGKWAIDIGNMGKFL